jgi:hypothetical protein
VEDKEEAQLFLELAWAGELLLAQAFLPFIGAGFCTKLTTWVGVECVSRALG